MKETVKVELLKDPECLMGFSCGEPSIDELIKKAYYETLLEKGYTYVAILNNRVIAVYQIAFITLSAEEISAIYQSRWEIELFFKHMKQHLTIKHYFSQSEEGVTNQVILAMIAYLLTYLMRLKLQTKRSIFQVLRTLRTLLFEPFEQLIVHLVPT